MSEMRYIPACMNNCADSVAPPASRRWRKSCCSEVIEFDLKTPSGPTTAVITVDLLLCGIKTFCCGNGDDVTLTPEQRLAAVGLVEKEREKRKEKDVKTMEGWLASSYGGFQEYVAIGDRVDEEIVDHFRNSMPPRYDYRGYLQAGEPFSHEHDEATGRWRATYATFEMTEAGWVYDGECFPGEKVDRAHYQGRIERLRQKIKTEMQSSRRPKNDATSI